jgi:hypothetical protein
MLFNNESLTQLYVLCFLEMILLCINLFKLLIINSLNTCFNWKTFVTFSFWIKIFVWMLLAISVFFKRTGLILILFNFYFKIFRKFGKFEIIEKFFDRLYLIYFDLINQYKSIMCKGSNPLWHIFSKGVFPLSQGLKLVSSMQRFDPFNFRKTLVA